LQKVEETWVLIDSLIQHETDVARIEGQPDPEITIASAPEIKV